MWCPPWLAARLIGIVVVLTVEPIRTTLGYGQVNTILMALVVADLLPDRARPAPADPAGKPDRLAAAIKLTPALFVVFAFLIGRRRTAITAIISFAVFTGIGAVLLPRETLIFFGGLSGGNTRTASPLYTGNQSLLGVFFRLVRLGSGHHPGRVGRRWDHRAVRHSGRGPLVAAQPEGVRGGSGRNDHLPRLAAVLDPSLRLDPAVRGRPACSAAALGPLAGRLWVVWVCICLPLAVLPYGGARSDSSTPCSSSWPTSDPSSASP